VATTPAPTESSSPDTTPIPETPNRNMGQELAPATTRSAAINPTMAAMKHAPMPKRRVASRPDPDVDIRDRP